MRSVGHLIPCRHAGPQQFWKDFKKITRSDLPVGVRENIAYISTDPRDSLAFGSPLQVLSAACMHTATGRPVAGVSPRELAAEMEIETLLNQPIRTLSGGESVKLALAKALAVSGTSSKLVVSSPFSWLSQANRTLFDRALDSYHRQQVPTEILALEGEDDLAPIQSESFWPGGVTKPTFSLVFAGARLAIGSPVNAVSDEQLYARVADFSGELVSPCLLAGENGQGKSLLAKSLAGAVTVRGRAVIKSSRVNGRARLLFQDVITQTLLRSFNGIVASVKANRRGRAEKLYQKLCRACENQPGENGEGSAALPRTLLEIKLILIAVRLAESPPALILDEPDWGLSRPDAISLVAAAISTAHDLGVSVILISHKPWWQPIVGSILNVKKVPLNEGDGPFEIQLEQV